MGFKQPLVGEKRCVTTLITTAEETSSRSGCTWVSLISTQVSLKNSPVSLFTLYSIISIIYSSHNFLFHSHLKSLSCKLVLVQYREYEYGLLL